jgi:hypothetical protein
MHLLNHRNISEAKVFVVQQPVSCEPIENISAKDFVRFLLSKKSNSEQCPALDIHT